MSPSFSSSFWHMLFFLCAKKPKKIKDKQTVISESNKQTNIRMEVQHERKTKENFAFKNSSPNLCFVNTF